MSIHPLDALRDELLAIDPSELDVIDLDIEAITKVALAAVPVVRSHRDEVEGSFAPAVGAERVRRHDELELRTHALAEAHRRWEDTDERVTGRRAQLIHACRGWRADLLLEVRPLLESGRIAHAEVRSLRGNERAGKNPANELSYGVWGQSPHLAAPAPRTSEEPRDLALDVTLLCAVLDGRVPYLDLSEPGRAAGALMAALDVHGPLAVAMRDATDLRRRAFTSFVRLWDELRRDFTYVRWETEDQDTIVPPLWPGEGCRKRPSASAIAMVTREPDDPFGSDPEA
ncbi:MAG: hypothetical protein J0L92_40900 [Deltaproteobacteria bacterium]|nr:hypothetical protein [Deltaproteobacteria bacterium]